MILFKRYKPMNPVFDDYVSRLATFDGWGDDVEQTPDMLAEAGFFFIGMLNLNDREMQNKKLQKLMKKFSIFRIIGIHCQI